MPYQDQDKSTPAPGATRSGGNDILAVFDALIDEGRITSEDAAQAIEKAQATGQQPFQVLVNEGKVVPSDLIRITSEKSGYEFFDLVDYEVDPTAASRLDGKIAKSENVLPLCFRSNRLVIAVPFKRVNDLHTQDNLARLTREQVHLVVAVKEDLANKINKVYRAESEIAALATGIVAEDAAEETGTFIIEAAGDDSEMERMVSLILAQAIDDGASDIHIDPGENELTLRFRIDGVMKTVGTYPKSLSKRLISRLKILANMDIAEKRKPQDGRLSQMHKGRKIDLRVAALPTVWEIEKVVMRILDNSTAQMALTDLGFEPENFTRFEQSYVKPYGMILVTGPTGSGKSTTLYATLNVVSNPRVNVITVEDPVEYRIPNINQVQVNVKAEMTFAAALKSILRSDPDIVLIGEIRDGETAHIAVEAALTGHLVLSTLHTNDAPSAITRLTEMGIEPFLVGSALDAVLAQRLCRRLCGKCKVEYKPDPEELEGLHNFPWEPGTDLPIIYRAKDGGCNVCNNNGYKGRMGLHEVMTVSEEISRLAVRRASSEEIGRVAVEQGMKTLIEDGWAKVLQGKTSIEEILRVVAN